MHEVIRFPCMQTSIIMYLVLVLPPGIIYTATISCMHAQQFADGYINFYDVQ